MAIVFWSAHVEQRKVKNVQIPKDIIQLLNQCKSQNVYKGLQSDYTGNKTGKINK